MDMSQPPASPHAMLADVTFGRATEAVTPLAPHLYVLTRDTVFLGLLHEVLELAGYRVTATGFVAATHAAIAASQPALVVLDLATRERLGRTLLERLHEEASTCTIPVVVVSTRRGYLARAWGDVARFGAQSVLALPFDIDDLLAVVRDALERAANGGARAAWRAARD